MNKREQEILQVLADKVRALTLEQVARTWWSATRWGRRRAKFALERLDSESWIHMQTVVARPLRCLERPLEVWEPNRPEPDFERLQAVLHRRAAEFARPQQIIYASRRSVDVFATCAMPTIKLTQMTHDLQVSEVFLNYRKRSESGRWLSEDRLPKSWPVKEQPDAVLADRDGKIQRAIEYGGDYPVSRLCELHDAIASAGIPYEIW